DMLRALAKTPAVLDTWFDELAKTAGSDARLDKAVNSLKQEFTDMEQAEYRARNIVDRLSLTMQASQLVAAGNPSVAEAFIASRLGEHGDRNYGTLPRGLDLDEVLKRANPWEGN
ncbi:MAG: DNA alkylation response protein, partial [Pseudomonadota bacterium]|nr:DNA alkylation response protein [Pseudomonadota bacterium]